MPGIANSPDASNNYDIAGADAIAANGAIGIKKGTLMITKAGVCVMTLALPTAGVDDGKVLALVDTTGNAHTVTTPATGFMPGTHTVFTFTGTAGNTASFRAWNGQWWASTASNGALSA